MKRIHLSLLVLAAFMAFCAGIYSTYGSITTPKNKVTPVFRIVAPLNALRGNVVLCIRKNVIRDITDMESADTQNLINILNGFVPGTVSYSASELDKESINILKACIREVARTCIPEMLTNSARRLKSGETTCIEDQNGTRFILEGTESVVKIKTVEPYNTAPDSREYTDLTRVFLDGRGFGALATAEKTGMVFAVMSSGINYVDAVCRIPIIETIDKDSKLKPLDKAILIKLCNIHGLDFDSQDLYANSWEKIERMAKEKGIVTINDIIAWSNEKNLEIGRIIKDCKRSSGYIAPDGKGGFVFVDMAVI